MSRLLKRLRVHGLIRRIGRTYKYYVTALGKQALTLGLKLKELYIIPALHPLNQADFLPKTANT
jgi:hypothetical protein